MSDPRRADRQGPRPAPLQFNLRTMLGVTAAFGLVFAVLRWIGAPPPVSLLVLLLLGVSVAAAIGLVVVIAASVAREDDERPGTERTSDSDQKPDEDE